MTVYLADLCRTRSAQYNYYSSELSSARQLGDRDK